MRRTKRMLGRIFVVVLVAAAIFVIPTVWLKPWSIDHFYARIFIRFALRHPMLLSDLRLLDRTGLDFYSDDLDDPSVAALRREARFVDDELRMLHSWDRKRMTESAGTSYDVLEWFLADQQRGNRFLLYDYPVNQLAGAQSLLPEFMLNTHSISRPKDAENYIERVSKFGWFFDRVIAGLAARESLGVVPPRFVIRKVLAEMQAFAAHPPREHPLYKHFETEVAKLGGLDSTRRNGLLRRLEGELSGTVYPAYGRLIDACGRLETVATDDDGVWKLPNGDAYYAWCLRHHTTTSLSPNDVHQLGLAEVSRIQGEMQAILTEQGYDARDLGKAMSGLNTEPRFVYPDTDSARTQVLADYQAILDDIDSKLGSMFDVRPKTGVKVQRVPEFREATAPGAYYNGPSIDGSRPGIFYANLRNVTETPKFEMRTLAYHEGIPGHHFQITVAQELKDLPFFRRIIPFTSYVEGWALYAERLAAENGFEDDPFDRLGYLRADMFRAVRLVVDTGIHAQHWTREQAIQYMLSNTGMPEGEAVSEIERYIVNPGQACAYKLGELRIVALRERAKQRLGSRFDIRRFHNVVLTSGAVPLDILEQRVDAWIRAEESAGKDTRG